MSRKFLSSKIICIEGIDGSGKSTQTSLVIEYLKSLNFKVAYLHYPLYGNNEASNIISQYLRGDLGPKEKINPYFLANIFGMDRFLSLSFLKRLSKENDFIILDRYVFSNMAFQGAKVKGPDELDKLINWIDEFEFGILDIPYPDLAIFLNTPVEIVESRLEERRKNESREYLNGKEDINESDLQFQSEVLKVYNELDKYFHRYEKIDCFKSVDGKIISLSPKEIFDIYKPHIDGIL